MQCVSDWTTTCCTWDFPHRPTNSIYRTYYAFSHIIICVRQHTCVSHMTMWQGHMALIYVVLASHDTHMWNLGHMCQIWECNMCVRWLGDTWHIGIIVFNVAIKGVCICICHICLRQVAQSHRSLRVFHMTVMWHVTPIICHIGLRWVICKIYMCRIWDCNMCVR